MRISVEVLHVVADGHVDVPTGIDLQGLLRHDRKLIRGDFQDLPV